MPRSASTAQGSRSTVSVRRGHGHNVSWKNDALCIEHNADKNSPLHNAWHVDSPRTKVELPDGTIVFGRRLIDAALSCCARCPVQWDCASYAVAAREEYLIWSMDRKDMQWLQSQDSADNSFNALIFIERARNRGESIQVAVRRRRLRLTG